MLKVQPRLSDLRALIARVPGYPITAGSLVQLAKNQQMDPSVIEFYQTFPDDEVFVNQEDLISRSEALAIMTREEKEQPFELWLAPEED
jgi:hypothetical protein